MSKIITLKIEMTLGNIDKCEESILALNRAIDKAHLKDLSKLVDIKNILIKLFEEFGCTSLSQYKEYVDKQGIRHSG